MRHIKEYFESYVEPVTTCYHLDIQYKIRFEISCLVPAMFTSGSPELHCGLFCVPHFKINKQLYVCCSKFCKQTAASARCKIKGGGGIQPLPLARCLGEEVQQYSSYNMDYLAPGLPHRWIAQEKKFVPVSIFNSSLLPSYFSSRISLSATQFC